MPLFRFTFCIVVAFLCQTHLARAVETIDYARDIKPILKAKCWSCHGALKQESSLRLDTGEFARRGGDSGPAIVPRRAEASELFRRITSDDADERMPPEGEAVSLEQVARIKAWIEQGATSPASERPQTNPREHWAFQPLASTMADVVPSIDNFIRQRLAEAHLHPAPRADDVALLRRLHYDLIGLPPTPDQITRYRNDNAPDSDSRLIDRLLASPRYGERWGQHWLDVVRYADTHGFEVNTERPNAWPYRDYVIGAFNTDKPYDRFVFEQLAGDSVNEDAATGFLVAAAVLLPGQIGKDEASKRLARQDSLDEIVVGTTATFLGLTVGCARCHDHKFDPIPQRDYYALQAFFAGVDYGDRPLQSTEIESRRTRANELQPRITALRQQLSQRSLAAFAGRTIIIDDEDAKRTTSLKTKNGHGTNPAGSGRGYKDDVGDRARVGNLSGGRYTWWPNKHDEDVFTYQPNADGRFRIWISWGVHDSGVHTRDARYLLDDDGDLATRADRRELATVDQYYFAGQSSGTSEKKPLWSGLLYVGEHDLRATSKIVLRGGETNTGITADVVVLQEPSPLNAKLPLLRAPVDPQDNDEHFTATTAKFVRFTTLATIDNNKHEPCIDELEVYDAKTGENIALASRGTHATSSGNYSDTGKHQLRHINDGQYGNGRSWISNERGGGWVQLELPQPTAIDRVRWARDRSAKFRDRLPVRYRIEVSNDGAMWTTIATSDDRLPMTSPFDPVQAIARHASVEDADAISQLSNELSLLEQEQQELRKPQLVYAGKFREPDRTRLLLRGDPEQPADDVAPQSLSIFPEPITVASEEEQSRRIALASWIVSPSNPLTGRVIVNRIWQYHFGRGLVETPSDFGMNGTSPSHPQLLDWLTREFVDRGWSMKALHRRIVSSATYQQSHRVEPQALAIDADCRLLWRFPTRRIEAEVIRDTMLMMSDRLSLETGGPGFNFFASRGGLSGFPPLSDFDTRGLRRMIYSHKVRMERVPVFGAFDCPDAGQATPARSQSTTAIQALNLFNSSFVLEQASEFAERVERDCGDDVDVQVSRTFMLAVGRIPSDEELQASCEIVREHGLATLCRVLFNSSEFLFMP